MDILSLENNKERTKAVELCTNLLEKRALIPVVGTGFSLDTPTDKKGVIPSSEDLNKELLNYITTYSGYDHKDLKEIELLSLYDLAGVFWSIFERIPPEGLRSFYSYIESNFQDISFQKEFQKAFLKVHWPYLFTLNYDTLIEDFSKDYYPIIPYHRINQYFAKDKIKLYKLHGDAKKFSETGDNKYFILSGDQYIKSMKDEENEDMLNELLTSFSSKSIIFFGCGLSEELDLLYSSQLAINEKAKSIDIRHQAIIYISFEPNGDPNSSFSLRTKDRLLQYGVTHIIRIFSEQQSKEFFNEIAVKTSNVTQPGIESFLEKYSAIRYETVEKNDIKCRDFLFQENLIWSSLGKHTITLPGYIVKRSEMDEAVKFISDGEPLCFISGNFFSGKTFFLLELAKYFTTKKVYIFPAGTNLTSEQIEVLLKKENALYCFDAKSLTAVQIKRMSTEKELDKIKKNGSNAIIVIDTSDAPMYKYIFEARNSYRIFKQFHISGIFNNEEAIQFNKNIGAISLPPYDKNETILDYIVHNEKELLFNSELDNSFLKPKKELLAQNQKKRIKALIMLATEIRIPAKRAIQFGIDIAINDMIKHSHNFSEASVIERDYSVYSGDSSGYEFVCNSRYWIIRALSTYATTEKNSIALIADAYMSIIQDYRTIYKDDVKFYQKSEPYYFFDHIQILFNQRWFHNSLKLMNSIYDKLLPILSDSFQFLHQKAKGKLVIAQVQLKYKRFYDCKNTLNDALFNITRAIELAEKYPDAKNIEETLLHMTYTKGRILIAYSCISIRHVPNAIETCYNLYQIQNTQHDAYDFVTGTGSDKFEFEEFKKILMFNQNVRGFKDLDTEKVEFLLKRWTGKKFIINKRKKHKN